MHVSFGHGSVLLRSCNIRVDDVMFSYHGGQKKAQRYVLKKFARWWWYQLDVRQLQRVVEFLRMRHWGKVCYVRLLVYIAKILQQN